ncbi:Hypothetical Protein FCC1311_083372 [Hondaea fermentalgiana]|uniref:Uncharacterized protein n=1 Tax=Hondaea fermentalgiana TaxID=2315210 RepID=A0A2R5GMI6_9STRA|nr:Hypothetical Protein FCC1311_083372 [Hondaea fermentalgiana]|eukprot:GBG32112.1 Hypothetical Protein FCC1311_083372 [Hondaea fermentalgiana]
MRFGHSGIKRKNSEIFDPDEIDELTEALETSQHRQYDNASRGFRSSSSSAAYTMTGAADFTEREMTTTVDPLSSSSNSSPMLSSRRAVHRKSLDSVVAPPLNVGVSMMNASNGSSGAHSGSAPKTHAGVSRALNRASSLDYAPQDSSSNTGSHHGKGGTYYFGNDAPSKRDYAPHAHYSRSALLQCGSSTYRVVLVLIVVLLLMDRIADMGAEEGGPPHTVVPKLIQSPSPRQEISRLRARLNATESRISALEGLARTQAATIKALHNAKPPLEQISQLVRNQSQETGDVVTSALSQLDPPARKSDKDKLRLLILGFCDANALEQPLKHFGKRLQALVVVASKESDMCEGRGVSALEALNQTHIAQGASADANVLQVVVTDPIKDGASAAGGFSSKYFDAILIDASPSATLSLLPELRDVWFPKLRNDGIVMGHAYGVKHPSSSQAQKVPVSWLKPSRATQTSGEIPLAEAAAVKLGVDKFFLEMRNKDRVEIDPLRVAGDTTWYFYKRKVSISDVFGDGGN